MNCRLYVLLFLSTINGLHSQLEFKIADSIIHISKNTSLTRLEVSISNTTNKPVYLISDLNFERKQIYVPETEEAIAAYYCDASFPVILGGIVLVREENSISYSQLESQVYADPIYPIDARIELTAFRTEEKKWRVEDRGEHRINRLRIKKLKILEPGNPILEHKRSEILNYISFKRRLITFEPNATKTFNLEVWPIDHYQKEYYETLLLKLMLPSYDGKEAKKLFLKAGQLYVAENLFNACLVSNEVKLVFD